MDDFHEKSGNGKVMRHWQDREIFNVLTFFIFFVHCVVRFHRLKFVHDFAFNVKDFLAVMTANSSTDNKLL